MSDSQSDDAAGELGDIAGEGSKISVSTENDTEVDIEEMDSIADYEEAMLPEEVAAKMEAKPALVPNSPKKEPSADSKKEGSAPKQDASASKKDSVPAEKTPAPSKDTASAPEPSKPTPSLDDGSKTKNPPNDSKPETVETAKPTPETTAAESPIVPELKPESIKEETKSEKHSEHLSKKSDRSSHHDSNENKSRSKSRHSSKNAPKEDRTKEDDRSGEKTPTPVSQSRSHRESPRSSRSHFKSSRTPSERKPFSQTPSTRTRSVPEERSQLKSSFDEYHQSSTKTSGHRQNRDPQKQRSSSYTTCARAETTPSHRDLFGETEEMSIVVDTNELVSISVSSGLQSLRDMFFDENDSHKGYLVAQEGHLEATYCSHRHGEEGEQPSRISHPSFNSHLEPSPILLPDIDQRTYIKDGGTSYTSISESTDCMITPGLSHVIVLLSAQLSIKLN